MLPVEKKSRLGRLFNGDGQVSPSPRTNWSYRRMDEERLARSHGKKEIVIRQYGLLAPLDWGQDCEEELERMDQLWNRLVDIHEAYVIKFRCTLENDSAFRTGREA